MDDQIRLNQCQETGLEAGVGKSRPNHGASKPDLATIAKQITKFFFPPGDLLPEEYRIVTIVLG
jgi:hypothetical protein